MRLILTLTGGGLTGPSTMRALSEGSLSIGRGASNGWMLPDPQQLLSRTHCAVALEGNRVVLTDLSSNGVFVNGAQQPTERDMRIVLTDGDFFRLGDYTIKATLIDDGDGTGSGYPGQAFSAPPSLNAGGRGPLDADPLAEPSGQFGDGPDPFSASHTPGFSHPIAHVAVNPRGTADPFDVQPRGSFGGVSGGLGGLAADDEDLFRGLKPSSEWSGLPQSDHSRATSMAMPIQRVVQTPSMDDFDKLLGGLEPKGMPHGASAPMMPQAAPSALGMPSISLDDLLGDVSPSAQPGVAPQMPAHPMPVQQLPVQQMPVQQMPAQQTPVQQMPVQQMPAPHAPESFGAGDPFGDVAPAAHRPVAPARPVAGHNPFEDPEPLPGTPRTSVPRPVVQPTAAEIQAHAMPAPMPAASPAPAAMHAAAPAAMPGASSAGLDAQAAFLAFLEGAGIAPSQVDGSDPASALRAAGAIYRAMAEGLREVLISRTEIKSEMRVERTMISSHGNNALKFSVTVDDAVLALLTPKRAGYMPPLAATKEAFSDLKQHEIAVMAGVQTALMDLLKRFDPETLEKRLAPSVLGALLPAARRARYWDGFRDAYKEISQEAEDDFQSIFGRSFARAYTAQTRKD